jgi:hypothetical protein
MKPIPLLSALVALLLLASAGSAFGQDDCRALANARGTHRLLLDDLRGVETAPLMTELKFGLDGLARKMTSESHSRNPIEFIRCQGRLPNDEYFSRLDKLRLLFNRDAVVEIWGDFDPVAKRGSMRLTLVPVQLSLLELHLAKPFGRYDVDLKLPPLSKLVLAQIRVVLFIALGKKALEAAEYEAAILHFCRARKSLSKGDVTGVSDLINYLEADINQAVAEATQGHEPSTVRTIGSGTPEQTCKNFL